MGRLRGRASSAFGTWSVLLGAGYSLDSPLWWKIRRLPPGDSSTLASRCSAFEFRLGDRPVAGKQLDVVVGDEVSPEELFIRLRAVWLFGTASRIGRCRNRTEGRPPTRIVLGRASHPFGFVKTLAG